MNEPKMFREVGITYCVPPFSYLEEIAVHSMLPVVYRWTNKRTGRTSTHTVRLFPEDVSRFPDLLAHWNKILPSEWEYTLTDCPLVVL
jgi:hypothetical protein